MVAAHTAKPPNPIHAIDQRASALKPFGAEANPSFAHNRHYSNSFQNVTAVYYKPSANQKLLVLRHLVEREDDTKKIVQEWRYENEVNNKYHVYCAEVIQSLTKF